MNEDEFFASLDEQFKKEFSEKTVKEFEALLDRWGKVALILPELEEMGAKIDWLENELGLIGININSVMMFALRIAVAKNVPPLDFCSTMVSGYMFGYMNALESQGAWSLEEYMKSHPLEQEDEDEDEDAGDEGFVKIHKFIQSTLPGEEFESIDDMGRFLRNSARALTKTFDDPNDDWAPMLLVSGKTGTSMIGIEVPEEPKIKDVLFTQALPQTIRKMLGKPKLVGVVLSVWALEGPDAPELRERTRKGISDDPERTEALMLYLGDRESNREMWSAPIFRDGEQGPSLGKWKKLDGTSGEGRVMEMMERIFS
jgi:hypothetical protein